MSPSLRNAPASGASAMGLVIADVGRYILGVPIQWVAHILPKPDVITIPKSRRCVRGVFVYENKLLPVIDLREHLEGVPTADDRYLVVVRDKEKEFAFPIGYVQDVTAIPIQRIKYPRHEEIAVDKALVRGYWDFSARRHGYIINCAAVYHDIIEKTPVTGESDASEDLA